MQDGSNLYPQERCFELNKLYEVVKRHNSELGEDLYALMDGGTYCGCLTAKGGREVDHLFQHGHTVMVRVTKVHAAKEPHYTQKLGRVQQFTHGRGTCWLDADEQGEGPSKGPDGEANPKCESSPSCATSACFRADTAKAGSGAHGSSKQAA